MSLRNKIPMVNKAIDFVYSNLDEPITAERVAECCGYSRHYFNQIFQQISGENLYSFIKRQKLEKAASFILKYPHYSITDIAAIIGYSSSNFAVAFKKHYHITPTEFRDGLASDIMPGKNQMIDRIRNSQDSDMTHETISSIGENISVKRLPEKYLEYERFIGPYGMLNLVWSHFFYRQQINAYDSLLNFYGLTYSDPLITNTNRCIHDLCIEVSEPKGQQYHYIPEADYVCFHYKGHIKDLYKKYSNFMGCWLPKHKPQS